MYDRSVLELVDVEAGALVTPYVHNFNYDTYAAPAPSNLTTVRVAANLNNVRGVSVTTPTSIAKLIFRTAAGSRAGNCSTLDIDPATIMFSDFWARSIPINGIEIGTVCVVNVTPGDANGDGVRDVRDVTFMERILAGFETLQTACPEDYLDINQATGGYDCLYITHPTNKTCTYCQDNRINILDVVALEYMLAWKCLDTTSGAPAIASSGPAMLKFVTNTDKRSVDLVVEGAVGLDTLQLDLSLLPGFEVSQVEAGELMEGARLVSNILGDRLLVIANLPGLSGSNGSGSILRLSFENDLPAVFGPEGMVVNTLILVNDQAISIPVELDFLAITSLRTPVQTKLYQNYPNPLNPETWIPFELVSIEKVSLNIYTVDGQLVRALNLGVKEAGVYVENGRAAYWDSKDAAGQEMASGVYLYQLKDGDFTSTRKMIVLK